MIKQQECEYRLAFEINNEKGHMIVYEPILTKEEADKRMKALEESVKEFWVDYYRQKARMEREKRKEANAGRQSISS